MLSKQRVLCLVSRVRRRSFGPNARQEMSKFVLLAAAFALGTSLALTGKTAPVDTLKSARIRAKARLREALAVDDKVSNPDAMTSVKTHNESIDDAVATDRRSRRRRLRQSLLINRSQVIAAVDALSIYNPTSAPAYDLDAFLGEWCQLNAPEFKGDLGLDADGRRQYSLGHMTFGVYEPKDLVCSIDKVLNPVKRRP